MEHHRKCAYADIDIHRCTCAELAYWFERELERERNRVAGVGAGHIFPPSNVEHGQQPAPLAPAPGAKNTYRDQAIEVATKALQHWRVSLTDLPSKYAETAIDAALGNGSLLTREHLEHSAERAEKQRDRAVGAEQRLYSEQQKNKRLELALRQLVHETSCMCADSEMYCSHCHAKTILGLNDA